MKFVCGLVYDKILHTRYNEQFRIRYDKQLCLRFANRCSLEKLIIAGEWIDMEICTVEKIIDFLIDRLS